MATKEIKMPHLGESVTEAAIVQWLVKPRRFSETL